MLFRCNADASVRKLSHSAEREPEVFTKHYFSKDSEL